VKPARRRRTFFPGHTLEKKSPKHLPQPPLCWTHLNNCAWWLVLGLPILKPIYWRGALFPLAQPYSSRPSVSGWAPVLLYAAKPDFSLFDSGCFTSLAVFLPPFPVAFLLPTSERCFPIGNELCVFFGLSLLRFPFLCAPLLNLRSLASFCCVYCRLRGFVKLNRLAPGALYANSGNVPKV